MSYKDWYIDRSFDIDVLIDISDSKYKHIKNSQLLDTMNFKHDDIAKRIKNIHIVKHYDTYDDFDITIETTKTHCIEIKYNQQYLTNTQLSKFNILLRAFLKLVIADIDTYEFTRVNHLVKITDSNNLVSIEIIKDIIYVKSKVTIRDSIYHIQFHKKTLETEHCIYTILSGSYEIYKFVGICRIVNISLESIKYDATDIERNDMKTLLESFDVVKCFNHLEDIYNDYIHANDFKLILPDIII